MSRRTSIVKALAEKLKEIDGTGPYTTNIHGNVFAKLKFWDEIDDFPSIYITPGSEQREYLPGEFKWGYLGVAVKVYCKGDDATEQLETLLSDIETLIDSTIALVYDSERGYDTTDIQIQSIVTDEGLLAPYAVGEVNLQVRYAVM